MCDSHATCAATRGRQFPQGQTLSFVLKAAATLVRNWIAFLSTLIHFPGSPLSSLPFISDPSPSTVPSPPPALHLFPPAAIDWLLTASLGFSHSPCWMQPRGSERAPRGEALRFHVNSPPYFSVSRLCSPLSARSRRPKVHFKDVPTSSRCHDDTSQAKLKPRKTI